MLVVKCAILSRVTPNLLVLPVRRATSPSEVSKILIIINKKEPIKLKIIFSYKNVIAAKIPADHIEYVSPFGVMPNRIDIRVKYGEKYLEKFLV